MILLIDNYDSFVYNLVQYIGEVSVEKTEMKVFRNDKLSIQEIQQMSPSHIVLSPGPCTPNEAGISLEVVKKFMGKIPILGICLGHQAIAQALGAKIIRAKSAFHGKTSSVFHNGEGIFSGLPNGFTATRYHSLAIARETLPDCLEITAETEDKEIMAVRHREYQDLIGLQFHPESIMTSVGKELLSKFLTYPVAVQDTYCQKKSYAVQG